MKSGMSTEVSNLGTVLVLGGTGKTGRRVASRLQEKGVAVRIASRGSITAPFDWNDATTWDGVLSGVESVYVTYSPDLAIPGAMETIREFVGCAVLANVKRLVLLSGRGEEEAQRCEKIVQESGLEWTVVRASWFNQNFSEGEFLEMVRAGAITLPATNVPEPFVDVQDIADVAVAALTEEDHNGEIYEVTGPRLLTFHEAADEISRASGRDVQFIPLARNEFAAGVADSGVLSDIAWLLNYLFDTVLDGRNAYVCDGVYRALGRAPRDFAVFARQVAESGAWRITEDVSKAQTENEPA